MKITSLLSILALGTTTLFASSAGAKSPRDSAEKVSGMSQDWKKNNKFDKAIHQNLITSLDFISDSDEYLIHSELDNDLRSRIEKARDEAIEKLSHQEEDMLPYLLLEYMGGAKERANSKTGNPNNTSTSANRFRAIEEAIIRTGLKAIPALTELHTSAVRNRALTLSSRTKELISRIAKMGDLEVEQAKIQMEFNRKAQRDQNSDPKSSVAEGRTDSLPIPQLEPMDVDPTK